MQSAFRYRGRDYSAAEIESIRQLVAAHRGLSRRRLSAKLCEAWNWVQPNGQPRDMVARSLMLELHRAGHLQLPAKRMSPPNNATAHWRPVSPELELPLEPAPLECSLGQLGPWKSGKCAARLRRDFLTGYSKATITWDILGPSGNISNPDLHA